jgi:hypothetical protein
MALEEVAARFIPEIWLAELKEALGGHPGG